jgi:ketosteroid isomerase-like protein
MKRKNVLLFVLIVSTVVGCGVNKVDTASEGEKLMQTSRDWSKAASTGNVDSILKYWADDAVVMSPGEAALVGKPAIRKMIEDVTKLPGFKISWEPLNATISQSGDIGYLIEQNQISMNDSTGKAITEHNKNVTIWKKQADGSWKNVVDIWNPDR